MADDKLKIKWSKRENDLMFYHPLGRGTKSDAHYLYGVFNKDFIKEMEQRGYDLKTLKFEIKPKLPNENKFPTLSSVENAP